jgi:Flp pilus assembly pilin Flp
MFGRKASLCRDEQGATLVEYALIVSLLALTCMFGARLLGTNINTQLSAVADTIGTTASAPANGSGGNGNNGNGNGNGNNGNGNGNNGNNGNGNGNNGNGNGHGG